MSAVVTPCRSVDGGPTVRQMLILWVPLAASITMMVFESSVINIGLGRTIEPELGLAAYGVACSLAYLVEAPIMMLIDASVARSTDRASFLLVRRFTLELGVLVTVIGLLLSVTPLYGLVVEGLMNIPVAVADRTRPVMLVLSFWPFPIAWRRTQQGLLIRAGRTTIISVATGIRLGVLAAAMAVGLILLPDKGTLVAGLAMLLSVTVESALTTWAAAPVLRGNLFGQDGAGTPQEPLTMPRLRRFYRPLAVSQILRQTTRPVLNAGIAAAPMALPSLAAWPVVWGFSMLIAGPVWSLQQLTTAVAVDPVACRRVWRFSFGLCVLSTLVSALVVFTPLYEMVMGGIYNLSPELQELARPAAQVLVVYPLVTGLVSVYRGLLIRGGDTAAVRTAMVVHVFTLVGSVVVGLLLLPLTGALLAALASLAGPLLELFWLHARARAIQ